MLRLINQPHYNLSWLLDPGRWWQWISWRYPHHYKVTNTFWLYKIIFSKWSFTWAIPGQKAEWIVKILKDHIFTVVGSLEQLHSDQGCNFESHILAALCKAFKITKSRTTPYQPMGDGLLKWMNRTLLNLLRTYTQEKGDWEEHIQLLLFVYRTTKHSSTGLSPHEILLDTTLHLSSHQILVFGR